MALRTCLLMHEDEAVHNGAIPGGKSRQVQNRSPVGGGHRARLCSLGDRYSVILLGIPNNPNVRSRATRQHNDLFQ